MNTRNISKLVKKEDPIISQNVKSILNKEEFYTPYLFAIEESVIAEYQLNKKINDKEIIQSLKNLHKNIDGQLELFKTPFEKRVYQYLVDALQVQSITLHELRLCISHVLWSIDNRKWLNDPQAYVKWLIHAAGVMDKKESIIYEQKVRTICHRKGIPKEQIDAMLMNDFSNLEVPDKENTNLESIYFGLPDDQKLDFVVEHFPVAPFLAEQRYHELLNEKKFDVAEELCKKLLEMMPGFPPLEMLLGIVYKEKGDFIQAKAQFEKSIALLDKIPLHIIPDKELMKKDIHKILKETTKK